MTADSVDRLVMFPQRPQCFDYLLVDLGDVPFDAFLSFYGHVCKGMQGADGQFALMQGALQHPNTIHSEITGYVIATHKPLRSCRFCALVGRQRLILGENLPSLALLALSKDSAHLPRKWHDLCQPNCIETEHLR